MRRRRPSQRWPGLASEDSLDGDERFSLGSFPTSAWRGLVLRALPGKAKTLPMRIGERLAQFRPLHPLACAAG
jgi:hypothetical protein